MRPAKLSCWPRKRRGCSDHDLIGTEHLLVGLIREGKRATKVLKALDISLEKVREKLQEEPGDPDVSTASPPELSIDAKPILDFTPTVEEVFALALSEALRLGHYVLGTEHLLLGVIQEGEGAGGRVLKSLGADLDQGQLHRFRARRNLGDARVRRQRVTASGDL